MKILILTSYYPPLGSSGHDVRCQQVAEALSARGHRLQVLTSNYRLPPMGVKTDKGIYRELILSAELSDELLEDVSYHDAMALDVKNAGILDNRLSRFNPDVVLVWDCIGLSKSLLMRMQNRGIRLVYDFHNNWIESRNYERDPWFYWWRKQSSASARWRKLWMALSGAARRVLRKLPARRANNLDLTNACVASCSLRETLVADGLESLREAPVYYSALKPNGIERKQVYRQEKRFMWAGRVSEAKAPDLALNAIARLKAQGHAVSLDIFGMGEPIERKAMRELIDSMELADCVRMVGIRPGEIGEHYVHYDALLFTSRFDDPFPMTPIEAMWAGLPCILSQGGGIQEVVDDEETAILFPCDDLAGLLSAIERFWAIPDGGRGLAQKCIERLQADYSLDIYLEKIEALMVSAVKPHV